MAANRARKVSSALTLLLTLSVGCGGIENREITQGFATQFDKIVEQRKEWDKFEKQADQYNEQLEKAFQEPNPVKRAKAFGAWVAQYKAMLSHARSQVEAESALIDTLVSDSAKLSGDANRYARECTDALRERVSAQREGVELAEQMVAQIESYIDEPRSTDPKRLEELTKEIEDLDSKEKQAIQRTQDAVTRLRAVAL